MKRFPLLIAIVLTILFTGLLAITYLPIMWLLGADSPYNAWVEFANKITFDKIESHK